MTTTLNTGEDAPPTGQPWTPFPIDTTGPLPQWVLDHANARAFQFVADIRLGVKVPSMWAAVTA